MDYIQTTELSNYSNNTAAVLNDSLKDFLFFEINPEFKRGNINHVKEPEGYNKYSIFTKGVRNFNGLIFTGNLAYSKIKELDRKWCSIYDYNSRFPYYTFDTIAGNWHKNDLSLSAGITKPYILDKLSVGFEASYWLTTGAKQTDPRALTRNNEINLSPSIIYHINKSNLLGFNFKWHKGKETSAQNYLNSFSNDNVFGFTGLGNLTISGLKKRYFTKNQIRPELLFLKKKANYSYMATLYYAPKNVITKVKWTQESTAESVINKYKTNEIGASFLLNKRKKSFAHFLHLQTSYILGKGESILSNATNEHGGVLYENNQLFPYHSDNSMAVNLTYSLFKFTKRNINYKISSDIAFDRTEMKYSGGINNQLTISSIRGKLYYQKMVFSKNGMTISLNAHTSYYYPFQSKFTMKTTFTSSNYAQMYYDYLTNNVAGYGLGINCSSIINKKNYNFIFSYTDEVGRKSGYNNRHLFSTKIVTYF